MSGTALVLHIEPSADCAREVHERLSLQLATLVQRPVNDVNALDAVLAEHPWSAILCSKNELKEPNTLHSFLDSLPGMACQIRLDKHGELHLPYVSEGSLDLLGVMPMELACNPQLLLRILHDDDKLPFRQSMLLSSKNGTAWNWEGRIVLPDTQEIKWLNLRAALHKSNSQGTSWKGFMVNITQNKQAEHEIKLSRGRLRELSSHIETIKEEERSRIAREIHDEIGVLLTALHMDLAWLKQRLPVENQALLDKAQDMTQLLDTAGKSVNNLVHSLRPGFLDCFGIVAAIEIEAGEFTKRTGIPCKISKSRDNLHVTDEQSITLFRVFQETLNNIMKHAQASQVTVQIFDKEACIEQSHKVDCIELIVRDNGCGFDDSARNKPRSFGLRGIQERIGQLGGKVKISSKPGKGTKIAVCMPAEKQ